MPEVHELPDRLAAVLLEERRAPVMLDVEGPGEAEVGAVDLASRASTRLGPCRLSIMRDFARSRSRVKVTIQRSPSPR
ncbi:MAG: hypothetical protein M3065_14415 [Actinomycetota bacterium]|nr:hypothetical protein [Actinomycetota bacterium]